MSKFSKTSASVVLYVTIQMVKCLKILKFWYEYFRYKIFPEYISAQNINLICL